MVQKEFLDTIKIFEKCDKSDHERKQLYQKDFHKSINREYFENTIENMSPTLFTSGYEERYSLPPYRSPTKMNEKITFEESHLSKKFLPRLTDIIIHDTFLYLFMIDD